MKDKIIEAAGKTWLTLGEQGEASIEQISKLINEKEPIVFQALGWLAREDKINYTTRNNRTFVSLVENELKVFNNTVQQAQAQNQIQSAAQGSSAKQSSRRKFII